jgi:hypothetical protein
MNTDIFKLYARNAAGVTLYAQPGAQVGIDVPTDTNGDNIWNSVELEAIQNSKIVLSGYFFESAKGNMCYHGIYNGQDAYIWDTDLSLWRNTASDATVVTAQNYLNELITFNENILENNLLCARIIEYCQGAGIALPTSARTQLFAIQNRLITRNKKIQNANDIDSTTINTASSPNFSVYNQALTDFMNNPGIGVFVVDDVVVIIVVAVILAGVSYASIQIYKSLNDEAKTDFKYSNDLTSQLVKFLPPDTYKQLINENAANQKKANDAINAANGGGLMNTIKYAAIGLGMFFVADRFILNKK